MPTQKIEIEKEEKTSREKCADTEKNKEKGGEDLRETVRRHRKQREEKGRSPKTSTEKKFHSRIT